MSRNTAELRDLLTRLDAYVGGATADGAPPPPPTTTEAMATYATAARLVEADLSQGWTQENLAVHRSVLAATQRMLQAALNAHGADPARRTSRPTLRLVHDCPAREG